MFALTAVIGGVVALVGAYATVAGVKASKEANRRQIIHERREADRDERQVSTELALRSLQQALERSDHDRLAENLRCTERIQALTRWVLNLQTQVVQMGAAPVGPPPTDGKETP